MTWWWSIFLLLLFYFLLYFILIFLFFTYLAKPIFQETSTKINTKNYQYYCKNKSTTILLSNKLPAIEMKSKFSQLCSEITRLQLSFERLDIISVQLSIRVQTMANCCWFVQWTSWSGTVFIKVITILESFIKIQSKLYLYCSQKPPDLVITLFELWLAKANGYSNYHTLFLALVVDTRTYLPSVYSNYFYEGIFSDFGQI